MPGPNLRDFPRQIASASLKHDIIDVTLVNRDDFPRQIASASLKPPRSLDQVIRGPDFPRQIASASLKQEYRPQLTFAETHFPRQIASASLKRDSRFLLGLPCRSFSEANCLGLIEARDVRTLSILPLPFSEANCLGLIEALFPDFFETPLEFRNATLTQIIFFQGSLARRWTGGNALRSEGEPERRRALPKTCDLYCIDPETEFTSPGGVKTPCQPPEFQIMNPSHSLRKHNSEISDPFFPSAS